MSSDEPTRDAGAQDASVPTDESERPEQAQTAEDGKQTGSASKMPRWAVLGAAAFSLAALIAAAVFGIGWWSASTDDNTGLAQARDDVVRVGGAAVKAYTEVDYQDLDGFFKRQLAVSDPAMAAQLQQTESSFRQQLTTAKTKVTTTIQDIAVEELDNHQGKASFLAAITTLVTQGTTSANKALRLEVQMSRVGSDWKLSGIDSVPLVSSGQ
jgi:Mce-associated membrane protein